MIALNGCQFEASEADVVIRTLALAAGEMNEGEYALWLKAHSRRKGKRN